MILVYYQTFYLYIYCLSAIYGMIISVFISIYINSIINYYEVIIKLFIFIILVFY